MRHSSVQAAEAETESFVSSQERRGWLSNPEEDLNASMQPLNSKIGSNAMDAIANLVAAKVSGGIPCRPILMRRREEAQTRIAAVSISNDFKPVPAALN